jgi:hypothetical protein
MTRQSPIYRVSASSIIDAPPATVYGIIANYRDHHPHIVPPEYFTGLDVLEGGVGTGTRTRVSMQVLGKKRVFEQVVTEPEPGRVIMETNADGSAVSTFTVDASGERASHVTIATDVPLQPGLHGILERLAVSLLFPRIYARELTRLAEYADRLRSGANAGQSR